MGHYKSGHDSSPLSAPTNYFLNFQMPPNVPTPASAPIFSDRRRRSQASSTGIAQLSSSLLSDTSSTTKLDSPLYYANSNSSILSGRGAPRMQNSASIEMSPHRVVPASSVSHPMTPHSGGPYSATPSNSSHPPSNETIFVGSPANNMFPVAQNSQTQPQLIGVSASHMCMQL